MKPNNTFDGATFNAYNVTIDGVKTKISYSHSYTSFMNNKKKLEKITLSPGERYGLHYKGNLSQFLVDHGYRIINHTDTMTDYFDSDATPIYPGETLFYPALIGGLKHQISRTKRQIKKLEKAQQTGKKIYSIRSLEEEYRCLEKMEKAISTQENLEEFARTYFLFPDDTQQQSTPVAPREEKEDITSSDVSESPISGLLSMKNGKLDFQIMSTQVTQRPKLSIVPETTQDYELIARENHERKTYQEHYETLSQYPVETYEEYVDLFEEFLRENPTPPRGLYTDNGDDNAAYWYGLMKNAITAYDELCQAKEKFLTLYAQAQTMQDVVYNQAITNIVNEYEKQFPY